MNWLWHNKDWIFSGIGVAAILAIVGIVRAVTRRSSSVAVGAPADTGPSRFTKPTPDEMLAQADAVPPFQRSATWDAYKGLTVCWQALFNDIYQYRADQSTNKKTATMKWAVRLKYYNPASPYPICGITCYDISLETYPQLKSMLKNELVIVSGTVVRAGDETQLKDVKLEFPGVRIKSRF